MKITAKHINSNLSLSFLNLRQIKRAIQYNTIQYNTIQYNTIQYNTIQYNTIHIVM